MTVELLDLEGRSSGLKISNNQELLDFFDTFSQREPFYCELVQNEYKLSVCVRNDLGSAQHSKADNDPPYMMAVTTAQHDSKDYVEFFVGGEPTPISARYALPIALLKDIIGYFLQSGNRSPELVWEEI